MSHSPINWTHSVCPIRVPQPASNKTHDFLMHLVVRLRSSYGIHNFITVEFVVAPWHLQIRCMIWRFLYCLLF